jgi:hypothetical protein
LRISSSRTGISHRPYRAKISLGRQLTQGFTLGYYRFLPPGGTVLIALNFLHFDLLMHLVFADN